ncbi:DIS3-like exonuclease 2 isoform X1 [Maniola hyperantus]|uniref:DIS3-like exonuclease 2 isoform X1 n=2 Tax=Aphantopus hyperantus TaxID=2795564 RepID=UPI0015680EAD|nr:DIS3-like exonuclease 2 [Maniola hyperantus]
MFNMKDSERNIVFNKPSTSQSYPPLRSKISDNTIHEVNTTFNPNKMPASVSNSKQQEPNKISTKVFYNSDGVCDLAEQCNALNISSDEENDQISNTNSSKKKNVRKRANLQLQMPSDETSAPIQSAPAAPIHGGQSSVHELFLKQITPLYASTSTRYLENLANNPQFHYTQTMYFRDMFQYHYFPASVPNTPLLQQSHNSTSQVYSHPALLQHQNIPPKFLQNVLQHPLLNKNFVNVNHHNTNQNHVAHPPMHIPGAQNNSPKRKKSRRHRNNEQDGEKSFDPYISAEEVETGLKNNLLLEGILRINPKQFQHSYVSSMDKSEQDVLIDGIKNRNRALEGDVVVVQYVDDDNEENDNENKQKKGKVVYIKDKVHNRTCIGVLKLMADKNRQKALFVPRDHRMPRLNIPFTSWPDNFYRDAKKYENTLFLAKILEWFDTRFALGHIVCNIGQSGDMQSETKAILAQTDLDIKPFGQEVRHLFPRLDYTIPDEEITLREDCRKLCIFSIDPFNCRDIDDAVSCRELGNGNYEIGVHISDVAHFLTENTLLDEKVAEKATTIYMVERAYHMLPDELCMLCSLFPGVDKLAFSVFWEITQNAQVISHRFAKTVINSCCQLAYDHAQAVLENKEDAEKTFPEIYNGFKYQDVFKTIQTLGRISAIFRKKRFDGGALRIDQPKVSFHLNPTNGLPDNFWIYDSKESHQLIEEFMLLANMTVAKRIHEDHPKLAFLRCHPPPSTYMLNQLAKSLKPMGIDIEISSAGDLHRSLLPYMDPENADRGKAMVLNMLCAKPMTRAKYFCAGSCDDDEDFHHYALNVPLYTHFTSPIRRYADIMVHRLLSASLNYRDVPEWEVDKVRMVAAQCNKQKYNAKKAGELSTELYTLKYIEMNSPLVTEAVVVEVREKYIDVIIVAMGLNRRIFFNNDFPGEHRCIKNDAGAKLSKMKLKWHSNDKSPAVEQVIEVFSILQVEMHKGDDMVKVETKLVRPKV